MVLVGMVLVSGYIWDIVWHERHAGGDTSPGEMLRAHAGIYAALALGSLVTALGVARPRPARDLYGVGLAAALLGGIGHAWDVAAHANGPGSGWAHAASTLGQAGLLALTAAILMRVRRERTG